MPKSTPIVHADRHRPEVGLRRPADRIAEKLRHFGEAFAVGQHTDAVAELEPSAGRGHHVHVAAAQACDGRAQPVLQIQLAKALAHHLLRGNKDAAVVQVRAVHLDLRFARRSEELLGALERLLVSHHGDNVAGPELRRGLGDIRRAVVLDAADHETVIFVQP